ncbi:MAG: potassium channel family protein [Muribaculaceae bacterium]|nr:potassium channel family protein [Muribaculaceae bacterium]
MSGLDKILSTKGARVFHVVMHVIMLTLSIFLIISISIDTFRGIQFYDAPRFVRLQTWICGWFLLDFVVEMLFARKRWRYFVRHFFFLLVSIPYLYIIYRLKIPLSPNVAYLVQYIPLIRGGYALAVVVGWFTYNKVTGIFVTYLVTLMAMVYFGSLVFFMFEMPTNPDVTVYSDALWWACMDTTTVGSNIYAITLEGRIVSVVLAASGMMMFPIFTVYITSVITNHRKKYDTIIRDGGTMEEKSKPSQTK